MTPGCPKTAEVLVLTSLRDVADARLRRLVDALVAADLTVRIDATGDPTGGPDGVTVVTRSRPTRPLRLLRSLLGPFRSPSRVLVLTDPDLFAPALLARKLGRVDIVVADVYEDYATVLHDRSWARGPAGIIGIAIAWLAERAARRADLTLVADAQVPPRRARRRLVVENRPSLEELPEPGPGESRRAVYVGDVRTSRGAIEMIEAVEAAPPWTLDIIGPLSDPDPSTVETAAARSDRIRLHGRLPLDRAWEVAAGACVGFALLEDTPAYRAAMPTKLYEYFGAGMAVLSTPLPRPAELVRSQNAGAVVSDGSDAAGMLRFWHDHPGELAEARRRGRAWAEAELGSPTPFDEAAAEIRQLLEASRGAQ